MTTVIVAFVVGAAVGCVCGYLFHKNNPDSVKTIEGVADSVKKHGK